MAKLKLATEDTNYIAENLTWNLTRYISYTWGVNTIGLYPCWTLSCNDLIQKQKASKTFVVTYQNEEGKQEGPIYYNQINELKSLH